ncbi:methyltransferase-like protein 17, mitochondrial [Oppia nitens]|uniref:methyltransferase-like protein 17, mitochondrial n=1 Tax=Oppia nitens TaxID=1686743 RepID=UPI0023DAA143|nr:methyltransferase-like protein 17, mitochondrial [Oppia nitens]
MLLNSLQLFSKSLNQTNNYKNQLIRFLSNKPKFAITINDDIDNQFEAGLKYRKHVGRRRVPIVSLPIRLEAAANTVIEKYNSQQFREDVKTMFRVIMDHKMPAEPNEMMAKKKEIRVRLMDKEAIDLKSMSPEERHEVLQRIDIKVEKRLKDSLLNHLPIEYNEWKAAVYLAARLPPNFASIYSVFKEIRAEIPDFVPKTLFDFGSGIGTTLWAANELWPKGFDEYFCVDINANMNELSRLLIQGGNENKKMIFDPVFYRQYLPVSHNIKYDLVVSAFSLLDIPDAKNRIHVIENLWHKTQDVLVIVEHGNRSGFAAVLEARNLILQLSGHKITANFNYNPNNSQLSTVSQSTDATIISPCPHDLTCPRQFTDGPVLCNFEITYNPLRYGQQKALTGRERYSYVVIRKTKEQTATKSWPRIVQPVLTGHHRAICRMCCSDGQIREVIATKSNHPKHAYKCAKQSDWGDKLPGLIYETQNNQNQD